MIELAVAVLIALYLAWCVGVHTVGSGVGITLGSGVLSLRNGILLTAVFAVIGALFLSGRIIHTISSELVKLDLVGLVVVLLSAGLLITFFAHKGIPIFTTYLLMGAIFGYSIVSGITLNQVLYTKILASLVISPLIAIGLGFLIYGSIKKFKIKKIKSIPKREAFERKFFLPSVFALALLAITIGGNSVGVAVGILGENLPYLTLGVIGVLGMIIGMSTWSYKIAKTVGLKITDLSPTRGFSAHFAAGLVTLGFITLAIPISTTQTLIGATIGVGIARGRTEGGTIKTIALSWIIGLPLSVGVAALLGWLI